MERAPTGVDLLDKILEGGIPRPASVLISGDIGTNKNTFAQQILFRGLLEGEKAIYVTIDAFPEDLIKNMLKYGMDVREFVRSGDLVFIDGFSPRVGVESNAPYIIENPFDPNEVLKAIVIAEKEVFGAGLPCRLVISHISTMLFMATKPQILSFIERMHAEARKYNGVYILVYSEGVMNPYVENFIKQLPDVVITLKRDAESGKRTMSIMRCVRTRYPRNPFEYELTDKGIVIKEAKRLVY